MSRHVPSEISHIRARSALSLTMLLMTGPAWAGPAQGYVNGTGAGTAVRRNGPCADLRCSNSSSCHCISGQGHVKIYTAGSQLPTMGSFTIEVSTEDTGSPKTADCGCFDAGAYVTIATRRGTVTLPISGPARPLQPDRHYNGPAPFQIASQTTMSGGTGDFKDSHGDGTASAVFDGPKVKIVLDWGG